MLGLRVPEAVLSGLNHHQVVISAVLLPAVRMFLLVVAVTAEGVMLHQDPPNPVHPQEVTRLPVAPPIQEAVTVAVATVAVEAVAVEAQAQEAAAVAAVVNANLIERYSISINS